MVWKMGGNVLRGRSAISIQDKWQLILIGKFRCGVVLLRSQVVHGYLGMLKSFKVVNVIGQLVVLWHGIMDADFGFGALPSLDE